jgi:endonuclease YncB( thermonuclease family)
LLCQAGEQWKTHEDCSLVEEYEGNDGDSFLVRCGRRQYVFRLYFVDAAETNDSFPDRNKEQADYWGIPEVRIQGIGEAGKRFTVAFLSRRPFTVYTKRQDARGRSDRKRYYALVKSGDQFLTTELVRAGLARVFGFGVDLPDGTPESEYWKELQTAEQAAKKARAGAWEGRSLARAPLKPRRAAAGCGDDREAPQP